MKAIKQFQVRGIPGEVSRVEIAGRTIDYWAPASGSDSLLIAHDGQNVFDGKTSTHRRRTWELGQSVNRVSHDLGITPPALIAVWNGNSKADPWARVKELSPEKVFKNNVRPVSDSVIPITPDDLYGDRYLTQIFTQYIPEILDEVNVRTTPERTAMIGSSMGGLCTLNALAEHHDKFHTALSLSTHWVIGGDPLVDALIGNLPRPDNYRVYMSRGTKGLDAQYQPFQERADLKMQEKGYRLNHDFISRVHHRTGHNEKSWASFIDEPISFWLRSLL